MSLRTCICPICGGSDLKEQEQYRGIHNTFMNLKRIHCLDCDLEFANPMPNKNDLDHYNCNYFEQAHGGKPQGKFSLAFFTGIAHLRFNYICSYLKRNSISVNSILEVGPGPGFFCKSWLRSYPQSQYYALESDSTCHKSLEELGVRILPSSGLMLTEGPFDLLVMSHVLEHVSDPIDFLLNISNNLRQAGVLFIEVPYRDYMYKTIDEPHLLFFNHASIACLLEKSGFERFEINFFGERINEGALAKRIRSFFMRVRGKIISSGFYYPFSRAAKGLDGLSALERAVLVPYKAHQESPTPTRWLRVMAIKN